MITIYHNPQCSKSRASLDLLASSDAEIIVKEYLHKTIDKAELRTILEMLGISPLDLIRKNESLFIEKFQDSKLSDEEWIEVMVNNPILIERPIVVKEGKAVIGRPIDKVVELISC